MDATAPGPGALAGLKVIDLTRVLGGPYCTMILSDHGADVIKVEPPAGDEVRDWGPPFLEREDGARDASYFLGVNRNKRALALDLGREEGRAVLWRLLEGADVLVENFKPGAMERWGLGYATLSQRFPGLIHCRVSGFGADGPLGGMPGYDAIVQAMTGLMSVNGAPGSGPTRMGTPVVDMGTGLYATIAILMALHERTRSGLGQYLDMTLHDCAMALLHPQAANWFLGGKRPRQTGNPHPNIAPYETFETATGTIFLAIGNDGQFRRLCARLGLEGLPDDARFASNAARVANRPALSMALGGALSGLDGQALCTELLAAGLPAGPVLPVDEAVASPQAAARGMVADAGGVQVLGTPIKLSRTPARAPAAPPRFGQDADAILAEHGYAPGEVAALEAAGVVLRRRRTGAG